MDVYLKDHGLLTYNGIDGFETCRKLKALASTAQVPVIFMTALTDVAHKVKAFQEGAVDYITKPFQQDEVIARVQTHLNLRQLQRDVERQNAQLHSQSEALHKQNHALQHALAQVKQLSGMLPICSNCKKIRDDDNYTKQVNNYIRQNEKIPFHHGLCPDCVKKQIEKEGL